METPKKPHNPMTSVEMVQWIEKGRSVTVPDGNGNRLTLVELLAQNVFNTLIARAAVADVTLTGLSMVALASIRKLGLNHADEPKLTPNYGVTSQS